MTEDKRKAIPVAWVKYSAGAMPHFVPVINGVVTFQCSAVEALKYEPLYALPDIDAAVAEEREMCAERLRNFMKKEACDHSFPFMTMTYDEVKAMKRLCEEEAEVQRNVGDLAMLVAQLVRALRKAAPEHDLPARAMDYLQREGLCGSPLRETHNVK